ncbi:MAG TPA: response regulator [Thermoanaerobaculia bacterium]|nr:response regulator [Thermoanaerobaculia bacterium]
MKATARLRRVLLIDDDEIIVGSLRHSLVAQGCGVDVVVEADAADALMRVNRYDVVVLDPYRTGAIHDQHALLGSIATLQPHAATIVLTAYPSPELASAVAATPASSLLAKPQSVVYLSELVGAR